jgi:hypothetical protein
LKTKNRVLENKKITRILKTRNWDTENKEIVLFNKKCGYLKQGTGIPKTRILQKSIENIK